MNLLPRLARLTHRLTGLPTHVRANDIQHDRPYCCTLGHIVRYSQLSPVQVNRLHSGAMVLCEAAGCARELFRTVVPQPSRGSDWGLDEVAP